MQMRCNFGWPFQPAPLALSAAKDRGKTHMTLRPIFTALLCLALASNAQAHVKKPKSNAVVTPKWSLIIHGGAGVLSRDKITPEKDAEIRAALTRALDAGSKILAEGGTSMDAVAAAIMVMEDDPNFNAGKGAVFTWDGTNEMDASIMDGKTLSAGSVAGINGTRNPILLARAVMEKSPHVMLTGKGANQFSIEQGLEQAPPEYFATEFRKQQLERMKAAKAASPNISSFDIDQKYGTVGAVAVDAKGNIAAGTSTGGMTGKRWGRVGDSPIIGAGTYADNRACGVSATGSGEYFIRLGVAHEICARIRFTGESAQAASNHVIKELGLLGGDGGVIVATPAGETAFSFNSAGMYRGVAKADGTKKVAIYGDEK
jgi:L-asparaginase / beta-aspartyl-peptidase